MADTFEFTDAQKALIREYCGYPPLRTDVGTLRYGFPANEATQLELHFQVLSIVEGERVVTLLDTCESLENAVLGAADNLEDRKIAVIETNPKEVAQRNALFTHYRRKLCDAMGIQPGPRLRGGKSLRLIV